jgi:hypothetical protein
MKEATNTMTESVAVVKPTKEELLAKLQQVMAAGDFRQIAKIGAELAAFQRSQESAEREAKEKAILSVVQNFRKAFEEWADAYIKDTDEMDLADGIWIKWEFEDPRAVGVNPEVKLLKGKSAAKQAGTATKSSGSTGKVFNVKTEDMFAEVEGKVFGNGEAGTIKAADKFTGKSPAEAYAESTDGNWRYQIRVALLKATGRM